MNVLEDLNGIACILQNTWRSCKPKRNRFFTYKYHGVVQIQYISIKIHNSVSVEPAIRSGTEFLRLVWPHGVAALFYGHCSMCIGGYAIMIEELSESREVTNIIPPGLEPIIFKMSISH
mgnify:CR=1 FL=1